MVDISTAKQSEYSELALFLSAFPTMKDDQDYWLSRFRHWWDSNPAYSDDMERGWVLRDDGNIVGFLGCIPTKIILLGKETTVFSSSTWMVESDYRIYSLRLYAKLLAVSSRTLLFNTTPIPAVAKMNEMLGMRLIDRGARNEEKFYIPVNFDKILKTKFSGSGLLKYTTKPLALILRCIQSIRMSPVPPKDFTNVRVVANADSLFDALWERTKRDYPTTNIRSAEAINWLCFGNKYIMKILLGYIEDGKLRGFMIFGKTTYNSLEQLDCIDIWIEPTSRTEAIINALIHFAMRHAENNSIDLIKFYNFNSRMSKHLSALGARRSRTKTRIEYLTGPKEITEQIRDDTSYLVGNQGDVYL